MDTSVCNSVGKIELQVMAKLIILKVIKILVDYHAVLFSGLQTFILWSTADTFSHHVLWGKKINNLFMLNINDEHWFIPGDPASSPRLV